MSKENVKEFMNEVQKDKKLQEKIKALSKSGKKVSEGAIVELAEESGFVFTVDELNEVAEEKKTELKAERELDDGALEQVAGGGVGLMLLSGFTIFIGCGLAFLISVDKGDANLCADF